MARPTFAIDTRTLAALRREQRLTQDALARRVARQMGRPDNDSLLRHYQRIEQTGKTSIAYATALAKVLDVSVPLLQGLENPEPYTYLQNIKTLLQQRLDAGDNPALRDRWQRHAKDNAEGALEYLAEDIAENIEYVQLIRNPAMIADLMQLTGLSMSELLAPANMRGFWFLSAASHVMQYSEVVDGVSSMNHRIGEIIENFLQHRRNDSTIRLWHDSPWVRMEICPQRTADRMLIDCTRCQPDATGLRWIAPSWRDTIFLEPGLLSHAYSSADVVIDFSGRTAPSDYSRLRLLVDEYDRPDEKPQRKFVVDGEFHAMPADLRRVAAIEGSTRVLYMNWLATGLRTALKPCLVQPSAPGWLVSINGIAVDIAIKDSRNWGALYAGLRYRITLAEETGAGQFVSVPVREEHLTTLVQSINGWLAEGDGLTPHPGGQSTV